MEEKNLNIREDLVKDMFDDNIKVLRCTNDTRSKSYVFDNQIHTAKEIIYDFYTKKNRWALLFAEMQSGKSGTFFSIPYIISRNKILIDKLGIDMFDNEINVFLLTGMNEKELISQFEKDIDSFTGMDINKNVLHNSEMRKFLSKSEFDWNITDEIVINRMRKNSLILIDESHYGSDKNQILDSFLKKILNINPNGDNTNLIKNNVYVVSISATPMAEFLNENTSEFKKKIIPLKNADGYFGIVNMFKTNKVHNAWDFKSDISIDFFLDKILSFRKDGYVLVRCNQKNQDAIKKRIGEKRISNIGIIDYYRHSKTKILDNTGINDILDHPAQKKTIIFLKGLLRAGKRINTKNVIMVHDTSESKVDTTVQSLLGRCCGYGKNTDILIYCDKFSAEKYKNWVESGFDINLLPDKSKNVLGKSSLSIKTIVDPIEIDVSNNTFIIDIMKKRKSKEDKIDILKSLNNDYINSIIKGEFEKDWNMGSIFNVDVKKHNDSIENKKKYTSYQKQYLDVLNNKIYMGDYKIKEESEEGKIIISGAYEIQEKKLLISFGKITKQIVTANDKSMYHETNIIN